MDVKRLTFLAVDEHGLVVQPLVAVIPMPRDWSNALPNRAESMPLDLLIDCIKDISASKTFSLWSPENDGEKSSITQHLG